MPEDTQLILQAKQGDTVAFERLVYRYDKRVLSIAGTYVNSADEVKDIYQEVFLRVFKGLPKFEERSQFSTWLHRITTNVCLTHKTRMKRRAHTSLDKELDGEEGQTTMLETISNDDSTDQHAINSEISLHVQEALDKLSPQQRFVFTLRHYQGYKLKEIAKMMGCTEGTVKKYLFTATRKMRDELRELYE